VIKNEYLMVNKPIHPVLFGLFPGVALLASNVSQVELADTDRVFFVSLLLIALFFAFAYLIARSWTKAALLSSFALALFFSYGHIFSATKGLSVGPILIGRTAVLVPIYVAMMLAGSWWILARVKEVRRITQMTNLVGVFLLAYPLYSVVSYHVQAKIIEANRPVHIPQELGQQFQGQVPNIYYIVLDMHARSDVLKGIFEYDLSWFTDSLETLGFYVAYESTSNYSSTLQSLSSSLNMEYINYLQELYGPDLTNRAHLGQLLLENEVTRILSDLGYKTGAFQSGDFYTEFRGADTYIKVTPEQIRQYQRFGYLNPFEGIFLQTTMARVFFDLGVFSQSSAIEQALETPYQIHRLTILNAFDHLSDFASEKEPYFVFAHIVSPHPPYVFGRNGEEIKHDQPFSLAGPARQNGGGENIDRYLDQLEFTDRLLLETVEKILSASTVPPIIIIQADHGPVSYTGEDEVEKSNMKEQHAILTAVYFPEGKYELLYPSVSPVNLFRIVLNTFFNGNYDLLPEKNYFIPHARPYDFIDVTDRVRTDPLSP
jgi:hypothetical protein